MTARLITPKIRVWRAPGRVNLIGEHTDYNLGLVLPMAIEQSCFIATMPATDGYLRVRSVQLGRAARWRVDDLSSLTPRNDWTDLIAGVAWVLARRGVQIPAQNVLIDSEIPVGSGLSSSAAVSVALALALGSPRDPLELAQIARAAETDFVGIPSGIMDEFISAAGQRGAAMLLDCRSLEWTPVRLPGEIAIVAVNSMVEHRLAASAYRTRVEECAAAAKLLGFPSLRDAKPADLISLTGVLRRRATHVVTENARVEAFVAASGRGALEQMGSLVTASHRSLRDDYEVSCPELDFLVDTALRLPGVLGARMMGGGFGGCTVNLLAPDQVRAFTSAIASSYDRYSGRVPEIYPCIASAGAGEVTS